MNKRMNHAVSFIPVDQINEPLTLTIGLSGTSGTGKTYTALLLARGIAKAKTGEEGQPIGYVDTENRRALHYKEDFPEMHHFDMQAVDEDGNMVGFNPERWIEVIDAAESAGLPVLVIDSFSHAWEGVGGCLDLHATTLDKLTGGDDSKRNARSQLAWAQVKPRYRRLIDRIVRAKLDIVICTRAKPVMQDPKTHQNARQTKTRLANVPWDVASDGDLLFEMTTMIMLDPVAPGCPVHQVKVADQFKSLFDPRKPMGVETGVAMAEWAVGQGDAQRQKQAIDEARNYARLGRDKLNTHWKKFKPGSTERRAMLSVMDELQELAEAADEAAVEESDDLPFASDPKPTPEQMEEAEKAALEAAQHAGEEA